MKKILKIIAIALAILVLALVAIPYFFKDQITNIAKTGINKSIDGDVNFSDISISLIKSFPNLEVEISDLSVIGHAPFQNDTLVYVKTFSGVVNIWKAIKGEYEVNELNIDGATIYAITNSQGISNYNISKKGDVSQSPMSTNVAPQNKSTVVGSKSTPTPTKNSDFKVQLHHLTIKNSNLNYIDSTSMMLAQVANLNLDLSGDFSTTQSQLDLKTSIASLLFSMNGTNYVNGAYIEFDSKINADLAQNKYTLLDNKFMINHFTMGMNGWIQSLDSSTVMDLKFAAKETSFESLLELIPEAYKSGLKGISTKGNLEFGGFAKGEIKNDQFPEFGVTANIKDGYVKYPDLPAAITNINVAMQVSHPNASNLDATVIAINNLAFSAADNQVQSNWTFKTPVSDLAINGNLNGSIDLKKLSTAIPLGDLKMLGQIKAQIALDGKLSQIQKQQYDKFKASGFMNLTDFSLQTPTLSKPVLIKASSMIFTPQAVKLSKMDMSIGESDFHLIGEISNYIPYLFSNGLLKGNFKYNSNLLNANELMALSKATAGPSPAGPSPASTLPAKTTSTATSTVTSHTVPAVDTTSSIQIPNNLDLVLNTQIDKIVYENLNITNTSGRITIKNSKAQLDNLLTHLLDGSLTLNGAYNTQNKAQGNTANMNLKISNFDISQTASSLPSVAKLAPIMKNIQGKMSAKVDFEGKFDTKQQILVKSINSKGNLTTSNITVDTLKVLDQLAAQVGMKSLATLHAKPLNLNFTISNGVVHIDTFKCNVNNYNATVWGTHTLDQQIDYYMRIPIPTENIGGAASQILGALGSSAKEIPVTINFKGDIKDPTMAIDFTEAKAIIANQVKAKTQDKLKDVLDGFLNKLK